MANLAVCLHDHGETTHDSEFTFERCPGQVKLGDDLTFKSTSLLKEEPTSRVYKGILSAPGHRLATYSSLTSVGG